MPKELLTPNSEYWEKCARHQNLTTTRFVAHLFLCDPCTDRLQHECFNDRPPIYEGLPVDGYCGLCNKQLRPMLRQWFVCPICLNVVLSYPKTFAASQFVHHFWDSTVRREFPNLRLEEREIVQIEPFVPGRRSQKTKAETIETLDFCVVDQSAASNQPLFYVEMKAGPGSIEEMREFQLDVNDSNDIANVCNRTGHPAYVFHVQVLEDYTPPTRRSVANGLWWTDIFTLAENLKTVKARRGEDKDAGYYDPRVFKAKEEFLEEIRAQRYLQLRERLSTNPLPVHAGRAKPANRNK